jgi:hypothetical protein
MTSDGSSIERLREYLQSLSPRARAMLLAELERALLRDEDAAGSQLVLQELRRTIRAAAQPVPRIGDAARQFFVPVEPFLIDGPADHKRVGRLARVSLEPIWEWIGRDLMPAEAKALSDDINRALLAENLMKAEQLVRALHNRAVQCMSAAIAALEPGDKAHRRFSVLVGTPRAIEDVTTLMRILGLRDTLAELARRLPDHYRTFEREDAEQVKALFEGLSTQRPSSQAPTQRSDFFLYGMVIVANRLAAPWQLIRLATRAAESDDTARIATTPYAAAVTIVLSELEHAVSELRSELKTGRPVAWLLRSIHDAARLMRTEMDLSVDSAWSRQLAAIRTMVSNLLTSELEATPGRVRRLLRPHSISEIVAGSQLDSIDVEEAEMRVELVEACRRYASELAVSEATLRTHSELTQYLETGTRILVDTLRQAGDAERPFRHSQVEAAVRFCRTVFGADYAGLLAKAAEVALQGAAANRRSARA